MLCCVYVRTTAHWLWLLLANVYYRGENHGADSGADDDDDDDDDDDVGDHGGKDGDADTLVATMMTVTMLTMIVVRTTTMSMIVTVMLAMVIAMRATIRKRRWTRMMLVISVWRIKHFLPPNSKRPVVRNPLALTVPYFWYSVCVRRARDSTGFPQHSRTWLDG